MGSYESAGVWHGFVRASDGTVTTIDPPGSVGTAVCCVDDQGRLAGDYFDDNDVDHGFTRSKSGKITSFDVSGAAGTMAVGMDRKRSDEGALVGTYSEGLDTYGFLRSP